MAFNKDKPFMTDLEWAFLKDHLKDTLVVLEYGSGSSTKCIGKLVSKLYSIEHHKGFFRTVNESVQSMDNVKIFCVPPTGFSTARPAVKEEYTRYINYTNELKVMFDVVLIDGRARQWCAEAVLPWVKDDGVMFIHDYTKRPYYKENVEKFWKNTSTIESMAKFIKR